MGTRVCSFLRLSYGRYVLVLSVIGWQNKRNPGQGLLFIILSLSYIPSYVHVRPGYREKSPDLQGTLMVHLRFYNKISRSHRLCNEN